MPKGLRTVSFRVRYRDQLLEVSLDHGTLTVSAAPGDAAAVCVRVGTDEVHLGAGETRKFVLHAPDTAAG